MLIKSDWRQRRFTLSENRMKGLGMIKLNLRARGLMFALLAIIGGATADVRAQVANDLLTKLPASDAVMYVDAERTLTQVLPRLLVNNQAHLTQINGDIDRFRERTGIDARTFKRVAVGMRFVEVGAGNVDVQSVAIASGTFNPGVMTAAARLASNGKYREEKYAGKTISLFTLSEQVKLLGVMNMGAGEIAVAPLDATTLAIGQAAGVRAAIDAAQGRNRASADVINLATQSSNAFFGFGGNVPASFVQGLDFPNEEIKRGVASIRQVYGSVGTTAKGFQVLTTARTAEAGAAQSLGNMIDALRQLAPLLTGTMRGDQGKLARAALDGLKVQTINNEVKLSLEMSDGDVALLIPRIIPNRAAR